MLHAYPACDDGKAMQRITARDDVLNTLRMGFDIDTGGSMSQSNGIQVCLPKGLR